MEALPGRVLIPAVLGLALSVVGASAVAQADTVVEPRAEQDRQSVARQMRFIATESELTPGQALERIREHGRPVQRDYPIFGFTDRSLWFLLRVRAPADQRHWFLEVSRPFTDRVQLYQYGSDGQHLGHWTSGDRVARDQRPLRHPHIAFPLTLPAQETSRLLLRVDSDNMVDMPAHLFSPEGFRRHKAGTHLASGIYYGIVAVMCLYNLLIFFSIRDRSYLFYVLYLAFFALMLLQRNGLALQWLWPGAPDWNHLSQPLLVLAALGLATLFAEHFLDLRHTRPRLARLFRGTALACLVGAVLAPLHFSLALWVTSTLLLPWTLLIVGVAAVRARQGFVPARFFLLAYAAVGTVTLAFWLRTLGVLEHTAVLEYALPAATAVEALLLSLALAHRMTVLKQENARIQQRARAELEQRVDERTRELHQALEARNEFLSTISHEVRTPLNGILGNVELLRDQQLDDEQRRHVRIVEQSGHTLLHLIDDVLDYARIEAGRVELEEQDFDLYTVPRHCVQLFEQKARENGVRLTTRISDDAEYRVCGDPLRLRQILNNLISNAIKFSPDGEVEVSVEHEGGDQVLFTVTDSGVGIAREQARRLFEHFYQIEPSTSRRHGGTGLGLAICRELVHQMGGTIDVDSETGRGSRFWFRLPLPAATPDQGAAEESGPVAFTPARVLIVDDNEINRMVAEGLCHKLGHDVTTAASGPRALTLLQDEAADADLVLMDCEMPDMDGFETTAEIRRRQAAGEIATMPVVALTAHAVPDKIRACYEAGMVAHIAKPVSRQHLGRIIEEVLHNDVAGADNQPPLQAG